MHLHISLFEGDRNAFYDPAEDEPLSPTGRAFLAGVLAHACELSAVTNQWINSYRRLATGFEAPATVSWTRRGPPRSCASRRGDPAARRARASSCARRTPRATRTSSCRSSSPPACAASSAATSCRPSPSTTPPTGMRLPLDLREATDLFEASELVRETLGDRLVDAYVANKRRETADERRTVTEFDRTRYLRLL